MNYENTYKYSAPDSIHVQGTGQSSSSPHTVSNQDSFDATSGYKSQSMNPHSYQQQQQQQQQSVSLSRTHSTPFTPSQQVAAADVPSMASSSHGGLGNTNSHSNTMATFSWAKSFNDSKGNNASSTSNNNGEIWSSIGMNTAASMNDNLLQNRLQSFNFGQSSVNVNNHNNNNNNRDISHQQSVYDPSSTPASSTLVSNSINNLAMKLSELPSTQRFQPAQFQPNMFAGGSRHTSQMSQPQSPLETYTATMNYTDRNVDTSASASSNILGLNYYTNRKSYSGVESAATTSQTKGSGFDVQDATTDTSASFSHKISSISSALNANDSNKVDHIEELKFQLQLKNSVIKNLEETNETLVSRIKAKTEDPVSSSDSSNFDVPNNHEKLYNQLANKLMATQNELEETKTRLESMMTAIYLNPTHSATKTGRYDEEEIAHKIITKMQMLTEENEQMARMLSYGKSKEKDITIGLLKKQNVELKERATKLETKLHELKTT